MNALLALARLSLDAVAIAEDIRYRVFGAGLTMLDEMVEEVAQWRTPW